jgi:nondiscriminating aspartyl-tRNA synthetase
MQRIRTIEIRAHVGERVRIAGWLHSMRAMGGINFLVVRDGWGLLQAVAESEAEIAPLIANGASLESVIAIEGDAVPMPQAPGGVELHNLRIELITPVVDPPVVPLNKPKLSASITTLLDTAT